jgi:alpha-tubulin suppressor-like RCC1 family protein
MDQHHLTPAGPTARQSQLDPNHHGGQHSCATRTDGTLRCWGDNGSGQLGIGNTTSQNLPQQVTS